LSAETRSPILAEYNVLLKHHTIYLCSQFFLNLCSRCQEIPTTQHYILDYRNSQYTSMKTPQFSLQVFTNLLSQHLKDQWASSLLVTNLQSAV